ncbi:MAG: hypothetical protein RL266_2515 [Bacteroidota bacterium]|jgi:hypothetical protein
MKQREVFAMKSKLLMVILGSSIALGGCSQCEECELNGSSETICETEFDSTEQYQDAIADREAAGASCTATGGF